MINRQIIRNKVVQLVYAYYVAGEQKIDVAERELMRSLEYANDLYYHLLNLMCTITHEAALRQEIYVARAIREGATMPSDKFVNNRFIKQLNENEQLQEWRKSRKMNWDEDLDFIRHLLTVIEHSSIVKEYLESEADDYEEDRMLWRKLYKQFIMGNEEVEATLEEESIYWNDDKDIVDTFVIKTIKRFDEQAGAQQELLPDYKDESDIEFAKTLLQSVLLNKEQYLSVMEQEAQNWQLQRMPFMDLVIMQCAIAEMKNFIDIPNQVTINEYLEITKVYSTPKSAAFINGILDNINKKFKLL